MGWGCLADLANLGARRAFLVADQVTVNLGFAGRAEELLREAGAEVCLFSAVEPDPSRDTCIAGFKEAEAFQPDLFVAIGGGSVMDAAKGIWAQYETPGKTLAELIDYGAVHPDRQSRARFVAVPTTSGTGSEVGQGAIITDRAANPPLKKALRAGFPTIALVDPEMAMSMPPMVTAATGYDAMVHATESYVSLIATDVTRALAVGAIRTILEWLPRAVADGKDREAREQMHYAATIGGMCMRGGLGIVHAAAHASGATFNLPHGMVNAILLPPGATFNAGDPATSARYAELARALGLGGSNDAESVSNLVAAFADLRARVGLPGSFAAAGVSAERFDRVVDALATNALADAPMAANPRKPTLEQMHLVLREAWSGLPA